MGAGRQCLRVQRQNRLLNLPQPCCGAGVRSWHEGEVPCDAAYDRSRMNTGPTVEGSFIDAAWQLFWLAAARA